VGCITKNCCVYYSLCKNYDVFVLCDCQKFVFNLTGTFTTVRARRTTSRTLKIHYKEYNMYMYPTPPSLGGSRKFGKRFIRINRIPNFRPPLAEGCMYPGRSSRSTSSTCVCLHWRLARNKRSCS